MHRSSGGGSGGRRGPNREGGAGSQWAPPDSGSMSRGPRTEVIHVGLSGDKKRRLLRPSYCATCVERESLR